MAFANPLALLWGLLAVPIVLLYRRKIRLRSDPVATDMIWQCVLAEQPRRDAWQRWRHPVSLAVQLTLLAVLVVALAEPWIPGPRRLVLLMDNSASMNATDVAPSRLGQARETAARLISTLRPCDRAAVLSCGGVVGVHCNLTNDHAVLHAALQAVPSTRENSPPGDAVALARRMLAEPTTCSIILLTDACFPQAAELAAADDIEILRVGRPTPNVAISLVSVRPSPGNPHACQVMAEVSNFSDTPEVCSLRVEIDEEPVPVIIDGRSADRLTLRLLSDEHIQQFFAVATAGASELSVQLDQADGFLHDNRVTRAIPQATALPEADKGPPEAVETVWAADLRAPSARSTEGDLRVPSGLGAEAAAIAPASPWPSPRLLLAVLGIALLALEWCFYQRRWVS
ncbi:MAG: VWA domain-containing protein [Pirellulales bacterium]|nr:VWA domain-containing protein [Pirellulales bacterium]